MNDVLLFLAGCIIGAGVGVVIGRRDTKARATKMEAEAFERGRAAGIAEEKQQLEVRVEPHQSSMSEWLGLKKVHTVGYTHQLYYRGVPVGGPQLIVTNVEERVDQDRLDRMLVAAGRVAEVYVKALVEKGVKAALQGATRGRG